MRAEPVAKVSTLQNRGVKYRLESRNKEFSVPPAESLHRRILDCELNIWHVIFARHAGVAEWQTLRT